MATTVHVIPRNGHWAVEPVNPPRPKQELVFTTQKAAIANARQLVRKDSGGQVVVHGRDGRVRGHYTYGMPTIQNPPGKKSLRIEKAVSKITLNRLVRGQESVPANRD